MTPESTTTGSNAGDRTPRREPQEQQMADLDELHTVILISTIGLLVSLIVGVRIDWAFWF